MTKKTAAISKDAPQNIATSTAVTVLASRPKEAQPTSIQRRGETAASREKRRRERNLEECHLLTMEPAAGIAAIKSDNSDSSKKFLALVDLMIIPSEPRRIIAARASVVSSREASAAGERGEE